MQVGTTKDQGLYNKPSVAVHPGALAGGTLTQYNTGWPKRNRRILENEQSTEWNSLGNCVRSCCKTDLRC